MDTKHIIKAFDFDPLLQKRLLEIPDEDRIKWFQLAVFLGKVHGYLIEVRKLEILLSKQLKEDMLPCFRNVSRLLDEDDFPDLGTLDAFDREISEEAEAEFTKRPDTFSNYITVSAANMLRDFLAGKLDDLRAK